VAGWVVELLTLNASVKNQLCSTLVLYFSTGSDAKSIQFHLLANSNVTSKVTIHIFRIRIAISIRFNLLWSICCFDYWCHI
jgi:hypothetical protein